MALRYVKSRREAIKYARKFGRKYDVRNMELTPLLGGKGYEVQFYGKRKRKIFF